MNELEIIPINKENNIFEFKLWNIKNKNELKKYKNKYKLMFIDMWTEQIKFLNKKIKIPDPNINIETLLIYNNADIFFIFEKNNLNIIGYIELNYYRSDNNNELTLHTVYLKESYRNKGFGNIIMQSIINYAEKNNYHRIALSVYVKNIIAFNLYQKYGFENNKVTMYKTLK